MDRSLLSALTAILVATLSLTAHANIALVEDIIEEVLLYNEGDKLVGERGVLRHPPPLKGTEYMVMANHNEGPEAGIISSNANMVNDLARQFNTRSLDEMSLKSFPQLRTLISQSLSSVCPAEPVDCSQRDLTYRPFDGVCNNLNNPRLGAAFTAQERLSPVVWEKRALVETRSDRAGVLVPLDPQGVRLRIPTYFSVAGTADLKLTIFEPDCKCDYQKMNNRGGGTVSERSPGIITYAVPANIFDSSCEYGTNLLVRGDTVTVNGRCSGTIYVCYQRPHIELELRKGKGRTSVLKVNGVQVDSDVNSEERYPNDEADAEPYWIRVTNSGNIRVGRRGESHRNKIFLRGRTPIRNLTSASSAQRYNLAISTLTSGSIYTRVPLEVIAELETDVFTSLTLDDYPHAFANGSMRFGFRRYLLKYTTYELKLRDVTRGITVTVKFGSSCFVSYEVNGEQKGFQQINSRRLRRATAFEDGEGNRFSSYGALWVTWLHNRISIGAGNRVGQNNLATALTINENDGMFSTEQVQIQSFSQALWLFDLVQHGTPRRTSVSGRQLPTARDVSLRVHTNIGGTEVLSPRLTMAIMNFGQFVDHDVIATPLEEVPGGEPLMCCANGKPLPTEEQCRFCFNINITSATDPNGSQGQFPFPQKECIQFVRSAITLNCGTSGDLRSREQLTAITSITDGSNIYGSSEREASELRAGENHSGALLRTSLGGRELPTTSEQGEAACNNAANTSQLCFQAGDFRSSEQPGLTGMHGLWVREHNRVATALINSGYPVSSKAEREIVFQEARRIVVAEYQNILYNGYLKAFMDESIFDSFDLGNGQCAYDSSLNVAALNEWGISYRMGHTWIRSTLEGDTLNLKDNFFNPALIHNRHSDFLHRNYYTARCPRTDRTLESAVTEDLFRTAEGALDLAALNIQRGRDHGVGYCEVRRALGLRVPLTFERAANIGLFKQGTSRRLKDVYDSICDIDLFTGIVAEQELADVRPGSTSTNGETLNRVLATFFRRAKCGDRYWFEFQDAGFTSNQLNNLKTITLASIICANTDDVTTIQPDVFNIGNSSTNIPVACSHIPSLDLSMFGYQSKKRSMETVAEAASILKQQATEHVENKRQLSGQVFSRNQTLQPGELSADDIDDGLDIVDEANMATTGESKRMFRIRGDRRPEDSSKPDLLTNRGIPNFLKSSEVEEASDEDSMADIDDGVDINSRRNGALGNHGVRGTGYAATTDSDGIKPEDNPYDSSSESSEGTDANPNRNIISGIRHSNVLLNKLEARKTDAVDQEIDQEDQEDKLLLETKVLKALLENLKNENQNGKLSKK